MIRRELKLIREHNDTSLWLADGLPARPDYDCLKVALHKVAYELEQVRKVEERREKELTR